MMEFEFHSVPRIIFGRGRFARVGELIAGMGKRALVIHGVGEELVKRTREMLGAVGVPCEFVRQRGEPKVSDVDEALALARECDCVLGLGGGSAMDAAKAVAGLMSNGGSALDYMEVVGKGRKIERPSAPWIAIPTTAGTGAEATRNAVIGYPEKRFKASIRSEHLLPRVAVVDAELHVDVRAEVTARSGMDALCQCIEAYTSTGANGMTDALALKGVGLAARALRRAYENGADLDAREEMALAALLSGICLTNAGLGAVHGFAAPLGASFPAPHGTVCAALLGPVIRENLLMAARSTPDHPLVQRYAEVVEAFGDWDVVAAIGKLTRDLRIPALAEFGIREEHIAPQVALAKKASSMRYNPVMLSDEALGRILEDGIRGQWGEA